MFQVHFVLSRVVSITCVLLASIHLLLFSKSEMSRGGNAELGNVRKSQEPLVSRVVRDFTSGLWESSHSSVRSR